MDVSYPTSCRCIRSGVKGNILEIIRIKKRNLVDEVYSQMNTMIETGTWAEGEKLAGETQLSKSFNVSRVVIREALQRLRSEKLIVTHQGMGSFVSNPQNYEQPGIHIDLTEKLYADMIAFRKSVEYMAIELSEEHATEEDFDTLRRCLEQMRNSMNDEKAFSVADFEFHRAVVQCGHNELLNRAVQSNRDIIIEIFLAMNSIPGSHRFGLDMHEQIINNLSMRKTKEVLRIYDSHASYNSARLAKFYKNES